MLPVCIRTVAAHTLCVKAVAMKFSSLHRDSALMKLSNYAKSFFSMQVKNLEYNLLGFSRIFIKEDINKGTLF